LGFFFLTSLACALGESAPPSKKKKDKGIKDQRGELTFPAGQHHTACEHRQDKGSWFRDTGNTTAFSFEVIVADHVVGDGGFRA
jgi:hypothetical protein